MTEAASGALPGPLRLAVGVVLVQAAALLVAGLALLAKTVFDHPHNAGLALFDVGMAVIGAAVFALGARGLSRVRPAARTPVVVLELLCLPVGYSLAFQAGRPAFGGPILIVALLAIYLLFTPPVRTLLDRRGEDL